MPFAAGTAWTARSGGTQITDVADESSTPLPSSQVVTDSAGAIAPFLGPDDASSTLWMDFGGGTRFLLVTTDLAGRVDMIESGGGGYVSTSRTITAGDGLAGGGDLSTNRTIDVEFGTTSGTVAAGDDSRIVGALQRSGGTMTGALTLAGAPSSNLHAATKSYVDSAVTGGGIPASTVNAKGDLIVGTADDTVGRLAAGANGQIPVADSSQTTGLRWAYTNPVVVALTDASTIAIDASLGNLFRVTLGGNRTLGNPTNGVDGQRILLEIAQDGSGSRTLSLGTAWALGTDVTGITLTTTASKVDYIGAVFNSAASKWRILAFSRGF